MRVEYILGPFDLALSDVLLQLASSSLSPSFLVGGSPAAGWRAP